MFQFYTRQMISAPIEEVWEFISKPQNLNKITPEKMDFRITSRELPEKMYPGMMISYKVRPVAGIRMRWITEITHVKEGHYFVDEQRAGPYKIWHHEHHIRSIGEQVEMTDLVSYLPPFGIFGKIANSFFIRNQLEAIFEYRKEALDRIFGANT